MKLAVAILVFLAGCPRPVCPTLATRCDGARAEVCAADGQWQLVADCAIDGATCGPVEDAVSCVLVTHE